MDLQLTNNVAVITGGASGIGRACAGCFAAEGADVAIWDRAENCQSIADELAAETGRTVLGLNVDVSDRDSIATALLQTESQLGPVDHLVHAAAIGSGKFGFPFTNLSPDDWPRVLEVNILGMVNIAHAIAPRMQKRQAGTMVFIASVAGQIGSPTDPPYSASKAANINFSQCLAKDLAPFEIRVNTVCPGMVQTPLNRSVWEAWNANQPKESQCNYDDWADNKIRNTVPLGRWQTAVDIAEMAVFLSSPRAKNVTGQTINVDGGTVMHW